jgi:class 3 adenylate cyclase
MLCPSCGHENRAGRRFCVHCGAGLEPSCPSCGARAEPGEPFCGECGKSLAGLFTPAAPPDPSYTPKHLAEKILTSRSALEGERKQVTVLFADVKGSMTSRVAPKRSAVSRWDGAADLSESIDPEDWHRIMERFFKILTDGVHRFEGTVNQYTGDGIMALFGAPIAHRRSHSPKSDALRWYARRAEPKTLGRSRQRRQQRPRFPRTALLAAVSAVEQMVAEPDRVETDLLSRARHRQVLRPAHLALDLRKLNADLHPRFF